MVVFAHHRLIIDYILEEYARYLPVVVRGGMSAEKKQSAVDKFTYDKGCKLFVGNIQAAGVGLNLQVASHIIFVEQSWVPGEMDQAVDRCHRMGQKNAVLAQCLVVKGSVEEQMMGSVIQKARNIRRVLQ